MLTVYILSPSFSTAYRYLFPDSSSFAKLGFTQLNGYRTCLFRILKTYFFAFGSI